MRKALFAAALLLLLVSRAAAGGGDAVRVLIVEGDFDAVPEEGETLSKLDSVSGDFVLGPSSYSGKLDIWRGPKGLYVINELPIEEYVEGVVKAEAGSDWVLEALKAQAVAVRTYVLYHKLRNKEKKYDVTSSVLHQAYNGENSDSMVAHAVRQTRGEVLTYGGEPILAYYHSTSGGKTELPEEVFGESLPYLKSVEADCTLSPLCLWARRIPIEEFEKATGTKGVSGVKVASHTVTGRVKEIEITANPGTFTVEARDLRKALGWKRLPSTDFILRLDDGSVDFEGRGYGHGVGLCQWSALEMALEGKDYREVLSFFYPGAEITSYEDK